MPASHGHLHLLQPNEPETAFTELRRYLLSLPNESLAQVAKFVKTNRLYEICPGTRERFRQIRDESDEFGAHTKGHPSQRAPVVSIIGYAVGGESEAIRLLEKTTFPPTAWDQIKAQFAADRWSRAESVALTRTRTPEWTAATQRQNPLLGGRQIVELEREVGHGDEVWVVAESTILEFDDPLVVDLVAHCVRRGAIYRYFFAESDTAKERTRVTRQFREFRTSLQRRVGAFESVTVGAFWVDRDYPFFAPGCSQVRIVRKDRSHDGDQWYWYLRHVVDPDASASYPNGVWIRLNRFYATEVRTSLERHTRWGGIERGTWLSSADDLGVSGHHVARAYIEQFSNKVDEYARLREFTHHRSGAAHRISAELEKWHGKRRSDAARILRYLDIGCGDGRVTGGVANWFERNRIHTEITAIDPSKAMAARAKAELAARKNVKYTKSATTRVGSLERMKVLSVGEFDVVTIIHAFYVTSPIYLLHVLNLLKPGGIALIYHGSEGTNAINVATQALDSFAHQDGVRRTFYEALRRQAEALLLDVIPMDKGGSAVRPRDAEERDRFLDLIVDLFYLPGEATELNGTKEKLRERVRTAIGESNSGLDDGQFALNEGLLVVQRPLDRKPSSSRR